MLWSTILGLFVDAEGRIGADRFLVVVDFECNPEIADGGRVPPLFAARGDNSSSCRPTFVPTSGSTVEFF